MGKRRPSRHARVECSRSPCYNRAKQPKRPGTSIRDDAGEWQMQKGTSRTATGKRVDRRTALATGLAGATAICSAGVRDEARFPRVRVTSVRRVFDNGEHNAFTDLVRYRGRYYLAFRSCPDGHGVHPTSLIVVLASDDLGTWRQVHRFSVPKRDTRDPHFLVFGDKLFVYTGCWYCGDHSPKRYEINEHLGYAAWTEDGQSWHGPKMLEGTYGHYIWRAAARDGRAYLCGRRKREFARTSSRAERDPLIESAMLVSDDGLIWRYHALFQESYGDETAFLFEPDGTVVAVARSGGGRNAVLCRAPKPYQQWSRRDLGRYIGGPMLVRWGDRYFVGGRKTAGGPPVTTFYWLNNGRLHEALTLPSGGDNSYPGFVELSPTRAVVSYYSSHEKDNRGRTRTAIYLAELELLA